MNNYQWYTEQWGKPTREDDLLFLLLTVGVFQVGLSWKAAAGEKSSIHEKFLPNEAGKSCRAVA